jgi:hypothetical protein
VTDLLTIFRSFPYIDHSIWGCIVFSHPLGRPFFLNESSQKLVTFHSSSCDGFSHSHPPRKDFHSSTSPSGDQMQFISKQSNTFGYFLPGLNPQSLSRFSRIFSRRWKERRLILRTPNLTGLEGLCGEFGFTEFSEFRPSMRLKEAEDADVLRANCGT